MTWSQLEDGAPAIARLGKRMLTETGIAFLATVRADGSPRAHPVSPIICRGELMLGLIDETPKARDVLRDPRCVLHALPGPGNTEFWVDALAEPQSKTSAGWWAARVPQLALPPGDRLFRLVIIAAHATIFEPGRNGRPSASRRHWRCGTSAGAWLGPMSASGESRASHAG